MGVDLRSHGEIGYNHPTHSTLAGEGQHATEIVSVSAPASKKKRSLLSRARGFVSGIKKAQPEIIVPPFEPYSSEEEPEYKPRADAIRGSAAILRSASRARSREPAMEPIIGNERMEYEWDGIRRRKSDSSRMRPNTADHNTLIRHPSLGMTHFPDSEAENEALHPNLLRRQRQQQIYSEEDDPSSLQHPNDSFDSRYEDTNTGVHQAQQQTVEEADAPRLGLSAKRQFSFQNIFQRQSGPRAEEPERLRISPTNKYLGVNPRGQVENSVTPDDAMSSWSLNSISGTITSRARIRSENGSNPAVPSGTISTSSDDSHHTAEEVANICNWQRGQSRFLELEDAIVIKPNRAGREHLGHGRTGIVEEVQCQSGAQTFVRKRIEIPSNSKFRKGQIMKAIELETKIMRKIEHPHVVKLIGSYQEKLSYRHYYFLLMFPVGENDLEAFLEIAAAIIQAGESEERAIHSNRLRTWFSCLASALTYLHSQGIHHEDVKPKNIIYRGDNIYFTDFGSSREIDLASQITSTENPALSTRLYAAPEAMTDEDGSLRRHGSKSDIFSLGIVFVEMLTVLEGKRVVELRENLPPPTPYHKMTAMFDNWFETHAYHYEICVKPMLAPERSDRPDAKETMTKFLWLNWEVRSCACQLSAEDFFSKQSSSTRGDGQHLKRSNSVPSRKSLPVSFL